LSYLEYLEFRSPLFSTKHYGDGKRSSRPTLLFFYNHPSLDRSALRVTKLVFKRSQHFALEEMRRLFLATTHFAAAWDALRNESSNPNKSNTPRPPLHPQQSVANILAASSIGQLVDMDLIRSLRKHKTPQAAGWDFTSLIIQGNEFAYQIPFPRSTYYTRTPPNERQGLDRVMTSTELAVSLVQACLSCWCTTTQLLGYPSTVAGLQSFLRDSKEAIEENAAQLAKAARALARALRQEGKLSYLSYCYSSCSLQRPFASLYSPSSTRSLKTFFSLLMNIDLSHDGAR
jgi:hypothetical protein